MKLSKSYKGPRLVRGVVPYGLILTILGYTAIALFVSAGIKKGYDFIYDRGAAAQAEKDQVLIDRANLERDAAVQTKDSYVDSYNKFVSDTLAAQIEADRIAAAERNRMLDEIARGQRSIADKERNIDELRDKLPESYAALRLPYLVVRMWNESAEGRSPDSDLLRSAMAESPSGNDGTLTEVTLLELLEAGLHNNAQAVQREVILSQWREYYGVNEKRFAEHAARAIPAPKK